MAKNTKNLKRCAWVPLNKPDYIAYHDTEWGVPIHDDRKLFEMLMLEGAQAGLSWYTVLQKRDMYRKLFKNFDPRKVAKLTDTELKQILKNPGIIRNRLKVFAARKNAKVFLEIQKEFGSFDAYVWEFVQNKTIVHRPKVLGGIPKTMPQAEVLSKDLKKRGMSFVGGSIMYAFMQATGLVDDHMKGCFRASNIV